MTAENTEAYIALLPGDGIGPEVIDAARIVLDAVAEHFERGFRFTESLIGGAAIDATGSALPDETIEACRAADAVLLGAVGGPKWDDPSARVRPEQGLLGLRATLGVYANVRPVKPYASLAHTSPLRPERIAGVDFVVVRELTSGIYFGEKRRETVGGEEQAIDVCKYSTSEIERIVRVAADLARGRRGKLTSVDKANVLETSRLWRSVTSRLIASEYPELQLEHALVDSCAMRLIQAPAEFDVIVTENMFGDILTDEAAVLSGSIGVLPSASLRTSRPGERPAGLYEPIHGSAPSIAGRQMANPIGTILSAALMLRHSLGWETEAYAIERAVQLAIDEGVVTVDLVEPGATPSSTGTVARRVAELVASAGSPAAASVSSV